MDAAPKPPPLTLFSFDHAHQPITPTSDFATGSDVDIGGLSTCALTPVPGPSADPATQEKGQEYLAFHGNLSLKVPPAYAGRIRTGYAAFRNKSRPTLFGEDTWDLGLYSHLRVVVGYRGWEGWRSRWSLNIQTDGPVRSVIVLGSVVCGRDLSNISGPIYSNTVSIFPLAHHPAHPAYLQT